MIVPNSRRLTSKTMTSKETENSLENNLTITFPLNANHKSHYMKLLAQ